jgi:adenine-specific DNA-methyltransferase
VRVVGQEFTEFAVAAIDYGLGFVPAARRMMKSISQKLRIAKVFSSEERAVIFEGDCRRMLQGIPDGAIQLVVTSPPYNIGKEYEKRLKLDDYIEQQAAVIKECVRVLGRSGSICWQVGNYVEKGGIIPLDSILHPIFSSLGLKMRNRIIWHFEHGLHCKNRFSGRYETIAWFTKSDRYVFNLDAVRVPQKYPGKKHFKGPKAGQFSCNPLGKNPGDIWTIPNVKNNHVEKTLHPCQFPMELIERLVLSLSNTDQWVLDPFLGVGTTVAAAIRHGRRGIGSELVPEYVALAKSRVSDASLGTLKTRPMNRPVYDPKDAGKSLTSFPWKRHGKSEKQLALLESTGKYGVAGK